MSRDQILKKTKIKWHLFEVKHEEVDEEKTFKHFILVRSSY